MVDGAGDDDYTLEVTTNAQRFLAEKDFANNTRTYFVRFIGDEVVAFEL